MTEQGRIRASGQTTAEEITKEVSEEADLPIEAHLPEETARRHLTPGFSRMRTEWNGQDRQTLVRVQRAIDRRILENFVGAYEVMNEVYRIVREPLVVGGVEQVDEIGEPVWQRNSTGTGFIEDFTRLNTKQREHLLFKITTSMFNWEQAAAEAWTEAMFAKVIWEESFSIGFDERPTGTVDDRRATGNIASREDRFFAVFTSAYSRRADAIVKSMERLALRIKDVMTS